MYTYYVKKAYSIYKSNAQLNQRCSLSGQYCNLNQQIFMNEALSDNRPV